MKLDDSVCRGSLIIHKGVRWVVIGDGVFTENTLSKWNGSTHKQFLGWRVILADDLEKAEITVGDLTTFKRYEEVDMFFPGVAYQVPYFIR
ncbi:MAG: hypothetical protein ACYC36_02525 [Bellilinea sp.]